MPHTRAGFTVEATAAAVRGARHRISATVRSWVGPCDDDLFFRLGLVASELLTDGLLHARGPMTVEVALEQDLVVIEVLDGSSAVPRPCATELDDERGRGFALIEALCLLQGSERTPFGKRCWAVLPMATTPGPAVEEIQGGTRGGSAPPHSARWSLTLGGERLLSSLFPAMPSCDVR